MNVTEATQLLTALRWLGYDPLSYTGGRPTDDEAMEAFAWLSARAGKALQLSVTDTATRAAAARLAERLAAADSDGDAQAVCRALAAHERHGGSIPWPAVRRPYEQWARRQEVGG